MHLTFLKLKVHRAWRAGAERMRLVVRLLVPVAIVCWCFTLNPSEAIAVTDISTRISDVTVYSDRAAVTRVAEADLPAGETTLAIADLPEELIDGSLQVQAEADAGLTLLSTDLRREVLSGAANPRVRARIDELAGCEKSRTGSRGSIAADLRQQAGKQ